MKATTPLDMVENPKKIKFAELDAAQLPLSLDDLDAAEISTNYALPAGLHPGNDSIALESAKSPYVDVIVVREQNKKGVGGMTSRVQRDNMFVGLLAAAECLDPDAPAAAAWPSAARSAFERIRAPQIRQPPRAAR